MNFYWKDEKDQVSSFFDVFRPHVNEVFFSYLSAAELYQFRKMNR
jgi:hypothetical protein